MADGTKAASLGITKGILDDLCSRFLVNLPEVERSDPVRVCFQAELAHWFYIDHYCPDPDNACRPIGIREFIRLIFHHVGYLEPFRRHVDAVVEDWRRYKSSVPTYGAALLSPCLRYVLLVQGFYAKNSWGFPKGKVNEEEEPHICAAREVYEEVGLNISALVSKRRFLESRVQCHTRLYLVPGIPLETAFEPRTRKEIRKIQWFRLRDMPASRFDLAAQNIGMAPNNFYTVQPFVEELQRWVVRHAGKQGLPDPMNPPLHRSAFHRPSHGELFSPIAGTSVEIPSIAVQNLLGMPSEAIEQAKILVYEAPPECPTPSEQPPPQSTTPKAKKARKKTSRATAPASSADVPLSQAWENVMLDEAALVQPWNIMRLVQPKPELSL